MQADAIFDVVRSIVLQVTGLSKCLKTEPNAPSPSGEYCTISISTNVSQRGQSIIRSENNTPGKLTIDVAPQALTEAKVNFYRGNAADYAQMLLQANKLPSVSEALFAAGLGWQRAGPVQKLTGLQGPEFESRAEVSLFFWHEVRFDGASQEEVNTIEQVPYAMFAQVSDGIIGDWGSEPKWNTIPNQYDRQSLLPTGLDLSLYVRPHPQNLPLLNWQLINNPPEITIDSLTGLVTVSAGAQIGSYPLVCSVDNAAGTGVSNQFTWAITLYDAPVWDIVPPWSISQEDLPETRDMNDYILEGEDLTTWSLSGAPAGMTIDQSGVVTVDNTTEVGTYSVTCSVQNQYGVATSNSFSLDISYAYIPDPPVWGVTPVPDQSDLDANLPVTLDLKDYLVPNAREISWHLIGAPAGMTVGDTGIITVADTIALGSYPITATASNVDGANVPSNEFSWTVSEFIAPAWGVIPDIYAEKTASYPVNVNLNAYVTGEELSGWSLSGEPTGVTVASNGILLIESTATPGAHIITCSVNNPGGSDTSAGFSLYMDGAVTGAPEISGEILEGLTIQGEAGTLADVNGLPDIGTWNWQWFRGDNETIAGATDRTYTLTADDVGYTIRAWASFEDLAGFDEGPIFTADTISVPQYDRPATGQPDISGTLAWGETLTGEIGTIQDVNGVPDISEFEWQWYQDDTIIDGATERNYVIAFDDILHALRVDASFTDGAGYPSGWLSSEDTAAIPSPYTEWTHDFATGIGPATVLRATTDTGIDYLAQPQIVPADKEVITGGRWDGAAWQDESVGYGVELKPGEGDPAATDVDVVITGLPGMPGDGVLPGTGLVSNYAIQHTFRITEDLSAMNNPAYFYEAGSSGDDGIKIYHAGSGILQIVLSIDSTATDADGTWSVDRSGDLSGTRYDVRLRKSQTPIDADNGATVWLYVDGVQAFTAAAPGDRTASHTAPIETISIGSQSVLDEATTAPAQHQITRISPPPNETAAIEGWDTWTEPTPILDPALPVDPPFLNFGEEGAPTQLLFAPLLDEADDWTSYTNPWTGQQLSIPHGGHPAAIIPGGFYACRNGAVWAPSTGYPNAHESVEVLASNWDKTVDAVEGVSKSFVHWRSSHPDDSGHGKTLWYGDGMLFWYAGPGVSYDELYYEFYIQISDELAAGYYLSGGNQMKVVRAYNWNENPDNFSSFAGDTNSPKCIWDFIRASLGFRNNISMFNRGKNISGSGDPLHPTTLPGNSLSAGNWSGSFTSATPGQAVPYGTDPQIPNKKDGGFIELGPNKPALPFEAILGKAGNSTFETQWTKIAFHMKMNSAPGAMDGVIQMWLDDQRILKCTDYAWTTDTWEDGPNKDQPILPEDMVGWNIVALGGNSWYNCYPLEAEHQEWYSIDKLRVYSSVPSHVPTDETYTP